MYGKNLIIIVFVIILFINNSKCKKESSLRSPRKVLQALLNQCIEKKDFFKCFKIQALKVANRAARIKSLNIIDGLSITANGQLKINSDSDFNFNESKFEKLSNDELDYLLADTTERFLDTHRVDLNIPKIIEITGNGFTEARKKGNKMHYGALLAALAIKGSFLAMAYKAIGVMSGTAIILGKMALLLAAILGLKKLLSEHQEKTTVEIIKSPKHVEEHVHSTKYEDDYDNRRNYLDHAMATHRRVYRFHIPEE